MTKAPSKQTGLHIITAVSSTSSDASTSSSADSAPFSNAQHRGSRLPSAVENVYADELFNRYSFVMDPSSVAAGIPYANEDRTNERRPSSQQDDGEGYPQGVEEEVDIYLHDEDGNVYLEKAVVRSRKDRRSSEGQTGEASLSSDARPADKKAAKDVHGKNLSDLWSPLDIQCRGINSTRS